MCGSHEAAYAAFHSGGSGGGLVTLGRLCVVLFAGIACLWHTMATDTLLQVLRPASWAEIPYWLQLASCVVFVTLLFTGTAAVGAVALLTRFSSAPFRYPHRTSPAP